MRRVFFLLFLIGCSTPKTQSNVTLTAVVSCVFPANIVISPIQGTIDFYDGSSLLVSVPVNDNTVSGFQETAQATYSLSLLAGTHVLHAHFTPGSPEFLPSDSPTQNYSGEAMIQFQIGRYAK